MPSTPDAMATSGRPLQLIKCGDDSDNYAFTLNEAHLDEVGGPLSAAAPLARRRASQRPVLPPRLPR